MALRPDAAGVTLIAISGQSASPEAVGVAELAWRPVVSTRGELGLVVHDDQQSRGIGRALGQQLLIEALVHGVHELHADLLPENRAALQLLMSSRIPCTLDYHDGMLHATLRLEQRHAALLERIRDETEGISRTEKLIQAMHQKLRL